MGFCGTPVVTKFVLQMKLFFLPLSARGLAHSKVWKQLWTEGNKSMTGDALYANTEKKPRQKCTSP